MSNEEFDTSVFATYLYLCFSLAELGCKVYRSYSPDFITKTYVFSWRNYKHTATFNVYSNDDQDVIAEMKKVIAMIKDEGEVNEST